MTRFLIWKTEFATFDLLHAFGLAVALSESFNDAVRLCDRGAAFVLEMEGKLDNRTPTCAIEDILVIPNADGIKNAGELARGNLDGLLAATFTMPGPRVLSTADLIMKAAQQPEVIVPSIKKVASQISRICRFAYRQSGPANHWTSSILVEYREDCASIPRFREANDNSLTLTMPLDPAFGYSSRRPFSDAMICQKTSLSMLSPRLGAAFAYIGAARCLRAQRVKGSAVLLYVPEFTDIVVEPHTCRDRLPANEVPTRHAMYGHWLSTWRTNHGSASGIMIQAMQTQGAKQSISTFRTRLSYAPLTYLAQCDCSSVVDYWRRVLSDEVEGAAEIDLLVDLLSTFEDAAIRAYLTDMARRSFGKSEPLYVHQIEEVQAMIECKPTNRSAMAQILRRTKGTLRFGQAIRLLAEHDRSAAREIIEDLDTVQSQDKLLRVLARSVQQCVLAKAKNNFILIPDEDDVGILLEDVAEYGVSNISGLLIILAAIWYPKIPDAQGTTGATTIEMQTATTESKG